jgi:hypothetical protein
VSNSCRLITDKASCFSIFLHCFSSCCNISLMSKKGKGSLCKRLKSFFRLGSSDKPSTSSRSPSGMAQSQYSVPTTTISASKATEPIETGESRPFVSERYLLTLVQVLGQNGKSRMTSCRSSTNGIDVTPNIQLCVF